MKQSKKALCGISFGHLILDLYAAILIPLYPIIATNLGINIANISLIIGIGHMTSSLLQPLFGYISNKINKRIFILSGLIFCSIFFPIAIKSNCTLFLMFCLILGITGNAFYHPQATLILKEYSKNSLELSKFMGIFLGLGTIGYSFGPYLSTFIYEKFGENKYLLISLVGLIITVLIYFFTPKINNINKTSSSESFLNVLKDIVKNKICVFLILISIIKATLVMSFGTYIPFILKNYHYSLKMTGLIMTLFFIMGGLSMIISSKIEKFIGIKGIIIASFIPILPLTMLFLYFINTNNTLATFLIISVGFFILLQAGSVLAYAQNIYPENPATISGIIQGFSLSIGSMLLIPFGYFAQSFGINIVLIVVSVLAFLISIITIKIKL